MIRKLSPYALSNVVARTMVWSEWNIVEEFMIKDVWPYTWIGLIKVEGLMVPSAEAMHGADEAMHENIRVRSHHPHLSRFITESSLMRGEE